ncbi:MAG: hypothetical protein RIS29_1762, partial [Bacteroidota bacterium]
MELRTATEMEKMDAEQLRSAVQRLNCYITTNKSEMKFHSTLVLPDYFPRIMRLISFSLFSASTGV